MKWIYRVIGLIIAVVDCFVFIFALYVAQIVQKLSLISKDDTYISYMEYFPKGVYVLLIIVLIIAGYIGIFIPNHLTNSK